MDTLAEINLKGFVEEQIDPTLDLFEEIEKLKKERDLALLYTSHNMNEITRICDEVIFLDHGKIVTQDTPLNLTKKFISFFFEKYGKWSKRYKIRYHHY